MQPLCKLQRLLARSFTGAVDAAGSSLPAVHDPSDGASSVHWMPLLTHARLPLGQQWMTACMCTWHVYEVHGCVVRHQRNSAVSMHPLGAYVGLNALLVHPGQLVKGLVQAG